MKPARLLPTWPIRIEHAQDSILSLFIFLVRLRSFDVKPIRGSLRSRCRTSWWSTRESKCRASSMRANRRSTSAGKRTASSSCPVSHLVLLGRGRRAGVSDWSIQRRSTPNLLFWPSTSYIIVLVGQLLALSSKSGPSKFLFFLPKLKNGDGQSRRQLLLPGNVAGTAVHSALLRANVMAIVSFICVFICFVCWNWIPNPGTIQT